MYFSASRFARLAADALDQVSKHRGIFPIVETPCKLVHVQRKILFADFVVTADDSALEEGPKRFNRIDVRGADYVLALTVAHDAMIHVRAQEPVSGMFIGRNQLHVFLNRLSDETIERCGIGILDYFRDDHSLASNRADDCDFVFCAGQTERLASTGVHIVCFSADESFVNFHDAIQRHHVAFHRGAPAHAEIPACVIGVRRFLSEDDAMDL